MAKSITALAPWFGSNRTNAAIPAEYLDGCNWIGVPFAGGMCEVPHFKAATLVINDLHKNLINLAKCVRDKLDLEQLKCQLNNTIFHPLELKASQEYLKHRTNPSGYRDAAYYFISIWMGRGGNAGTNDELSGNLPVRWNGNGGDSCKRFRSAVESLDKWHEVFQRANFTVMDAFKFLDQAKDLPNNGLYCDPPWPDAGAEYTFGFTEQDQEKLARRLLQFESCKIVVRLNDHQLTRRLYSEADWNWRHVESRNQANNEVREVYLMRNFNGE